MAKKDRGRLDATRAESLAADILEGRTRADARRLLELIHAVNPTGWALAEPERERRYRVKARLQSVLLRDFGDDVQVRLDPKAPGTVTLWHRYAGADACHAVVEELHEDARSLVRWRLDVSDADDGLAADRAPHAAPAGTGVLPADSAASELKLGRAAVTAFDFDAAQEHLGAAVRLSRGAPEAAVPLLELLIDHLAAYRDALALEEALPAETVARPRVRALLAMAAARCSERAAATRLLKGTDAAAAAEVLAILAADACQAGEVDEAQRHVVELRERDPAHPELVRLAAEVARLRSAARQPLEEALRGTLERGELAAAEQQARALLARWPDSEAATRALAQIDARRRREAAAARLTAAEEALAAGDLGRAASLAHEVRTLGGNAAALETRVAAARENATREARHAQVEETVARLGGSRGLEAASLLAYLALDGEQRAAVREQALAPQLEWLEAIRAARPRERPEALVAAVLVVRAAEDALTGTGGFAAALAVLTPHAEVVEAVSHARALLARARQEQRAAREAAAVAALTSAHGALAAGDVATALALLPQAEARSLPAELREERDRLESVARRREEVQRRAARVAELAAKDPLAARDEATRLADLTDGAERAEWTRRRDELTAAAQRAFHLRVTDVCGLPDAGRIAAVVADLHGEVERLLDPDGNEIFIVVTRHEWVFVCGLDAGSATCRRLATLRTPEPLDHATAQVAPGALWIIGAGGAALELGLPNLDVRRWRGPGDVPSDEVCENALVAPGGRYLWLTSTARALGRPGATRVVDLERGGVWRELPRGCFKLVPLPAPATPRVACLQVDERGSLHEVDGTRVEWPRVPPDAQIDSIARDPASDGWLIIGWGLIASAKATIARLTREGPAGTWEVPGPNSDAGGELLTARASGRAFVHYDTGEGDCEIVAFDVSPQALVERYRTRVSHATTLVCDPAGERVVAVARSEADLALCELGAAAPELPLWDGPEGILPRVSPPFYHCGHSVSLELLESSQELARGSIPDQEVRVRTWRAAGADGVAPTAGLAYVLWEDGQRQRAAALAGEALLRHPGDPVLMLLSAGWAAEEQRWETVTEMLGGAVPAALPEGQASHWLHLLGCAHLHLGDIEPARRAWVEGQHRGGGYCQLEECLAMITPLPEPLADADWDEGQPALRQILGAIRVADGHLAADDATAARRASWREAVLSRQELQSLARLAEAVLHEEPADGAAWFCATYGLAMFLDARTEQPPGPRLVIPGATWDEARLADLEVRARAWLGSAAPGTTVALAWYLPEQWERLREISADREVLEATHAEWLAQAEAAMGRLRDAGTSVRRVEVEVAELEAWCRAQGLRVDARSRARYAAERFAEQDRHVEAPWQA